MSVDPTQRLSAGSSHYQNLAGFPFGNGQEITCHRPKFGQLLCLSVPPDTPVRAHPNDSSQIISYTHDVVAFDNLQIGNYIAILFYIGTMGWIDGTKIRPHRGPRSDSTRIIPDRDRQMRPIFVIN